VVIILVCRTAGSALADPLEAEDPPLAGKTPEFIRLRWNMSLRKKIEIEKAHK